MGSWRLDSELDLILGRLGSYVATPDSGLGDQPVGTLQQFGQFAILLFERLDAES